MTLGSIIDKVFKLLESGDIDKFEKAYERGKITGYKEDIPFFVPWIQKYRIATNTPV